MKVTRIAPLTRLVLAAVLGVFATLAVAAVATLMATPAHAASDSGSGLNYTDNGSSITIDGCTGTCPATLVIPDQINSGGTFKNVTTIGYQAFYSNTQIVHVTLGAHVTSIDTWAFTSATNLTDIALGSSLTSIGQEAFFGATGLTGINLPSTVTTIGVGAFRGTTSLTGTVTIPNGVQTVSGEAFYGSNLTGVTIGSGVTALNSAAFKGNTNLTTIRFLGGYPSIYAVGSSGSAFYNTGAATIYYKSGASGSWPATLDGHTVTAQAPPTIDTQPTSTTVATGGSTSLMVAASAGTGGGTLTYQWKKNGSNIAGATGATYAINNASQADIGTYTVDATTWAGTTTSAAATVLISGTSGSLTYTDDGSAITITGCVGGFMACPSSITIPATISSGVSAKPVTAIGNGAFFTASALTSATIGDNVTSIGDLAFSATGLTSVTIGDHVTTIGLAAFQGSAGITSVVIPDSVTTIKNGAFYGVTGLTTVTIGSGVTDIKNVVFGGDTNLTSVRFLGNAPSFGTTPFDTSGSAPIYYRAASTGTWPSTLDGHTLTPVAPPAINTQPANTTATAGSAATLSVAADAGNGGGTLTYQWKKAGSSIGGATGSSYTIATTSLSDAGSYTVDVTNWAGSTTSAAATLTVATSGSSGGLDYFDNGVTIAITGCTGGSSSCPTNLTIPSTITSGGTPKNVTAINDNAFLNSSSLHSATVANNVTSIGSCAFCYASNLTSVTLGPSVTTIGNIAFAFANLSSATIPVGVTTIGTNPFVGNPGLTGIATEPGNASFSSSGGVLFNSGQTTLISYPAGATATSYTIPGTVTSIGGSAFFRAVNLTGISVPDGVTTIGQEAFKEATGLTNVTVGNGVTSVALGAFQLDTGLSTVRFLGDAPSFASSAFDSSGSTAIYYRASATGTWPNTLGGHSFIAVSAPSIGTQPANTTVAPGSPATLTVSASAGTGGGTLTYQWKKSGSPIGGATSTTYTIPTASLSDSGSYTVDVSSWAGTTSSSAATLTVAASTNNTPPSSSNPSSPAPTAQTVIVKLPATLKVKKTYSLPNATTQGSRLTWKVEGKKYCTIKKATQLRCTIPTKKKTVTLRAVASATSSLTAYDTAFKRKVR